MRTLTFPFETCKAKINCSEFENPFLFRQTLFWQKRNRFCCIIIYRVEVFSLKIILVDSQSLKSIEKFIDENSTTARRKQQNNVFKYFDEID